MHTTPREALERPDAAVAVATLAPVSVGGGAQPRSGSLPLSERVARVGALPGTQARAILAILTAGVLLGTLGTVSHVSYDAGLTPLSFAAWRGGLAALVLVAFALVRSRAGRAPLRVWRGVPAAQRRALLGATVANLVLTLALFTAYDRIPVAVAVLAFYSYPAFVAIVGRVTGREPLSARRAGAVACALVGTGLVVAAKLDVGAGVALDAFGIGMAVTAAFGKTAYITVSRAGFDRVHATDAILVILGGTGLGGALAALVAGGPGLLAGPLAHPAAWPAVLVGATISGAIPMSLFIAGVRRLGGTRTAVLMLVEPVTSVVVAATVLGETIVPLQLAGAALVLAAGVAVQRTR